MKWFFPYLDRFQPSDGKYSDWKEQIARDCGGRCIYCAISEARNGGIDNFHVDHYRPFSKFPDLENTISNLFFACAICNRFKSNDWPNEPLQDHSCECYVNPTQFDYNDLFGIDSQSYEIDGSYTASAYAVTRLYLNRPQLIRERRHQAISESLDYLYDWYVAACVKFMESDINSDAVKSLLGFSMELMAAMKLNKDAYQVRPYITDEIRK